MIKILKIPKKCYTQKKVFKVLFKIYNPLGIWRWHWLSNNVEQDLFLIQDLLFFVLNQALKIIYNNLKGKNNSDAK